ncbi:hypothetical protein TRAPUB_8575, partial [Trametes pubescens]
IVEYLTPKDLLQLYRSNKAMREYLGRSGKHEWRCAWKNEPDLPPCPPWLTEPQFAALCFDDHCQNCLQPDLNGAGLVWKFNARYCSACMSTQLTIKHPLEGLPRGPYLKKFINKPYLCVPYTPHQVVLEDRQITRNHFHIPHITRLHRDILAASDGPGGDAELNKRRLSVMRQWEAQLREYSVHAARCTIWQTAREERIRVQILLAKQRRREAIFARIRVLGYAMEIQYLGREFEALEGSVLAVFDKVDPLTEDDWAIISPTVIAFFDQRRTLWQWYSHRLTVGSRLSELTKALNEYRRTHRDEILPHPVDICTDPMLVHTFTLPVSVNLPYQIFLSLVPEWIQAWKQRRQGVLVSMLAQNAPTTLGFTERASDPHALPFDMLTQSCHNTPSRALTRATNGLLSLPASIFARFYCMVCATVISHTAAMTHACCYRAEHNWRDGAFYTPSLDGKFPPATDDVLEAACARRFYGIIHWSPASLLPCATVINDLLATLGLNLKSRRLDIGKIDNIRVACLSCRRDKAFLVMGWKRAVEHAFQAHHGCGVRWAVVPPAVVYKAQSVEYARRKLTHEETANLATWECSHCELPHVMAVHTKQRLGLHMRVHHNVTFATFGQDYHEAPERVEFMHPPILIAAIELRGGDLNASFQDGEICPKVL